MPAAKPSSSTAAEAGQGDGDADAPKCWLMKAEPETRLEKGKDVAFSAQMFEEAGASPWDGVRNHQAKNFMRDQMRIGDRVLFYHSNCKAPGIAALAKVCKEGYPDYTAWDPEHPYYDPKSDKDKPTWFMVDVKFSRHMPHFVSLKTLQILVAADQAEVPEYLTSEQVQAIREMALLSRGRLSVQSVSPEAYDAICLLGDKGGFDHLRADKPKTAKGNPKRKPQESAAAETESKTKKSKRAT